MLNAGPPGVLGCTRQNLNDRYSELKRELKEIKRARQQLEVAAAEDREGVATGETLYGAAFVNPPALGAVKRQKCRWSGSHSAMDQLAAGQFGRAADVATQRYKVVEIAMQDGDWKRASHLELMADAKRLFAGRDEQELIKELRHEMRLRKFLDEGRAPWRKGSDAKGKGQQGKHPDKGKRHPHFKSQSKGKSSDRGQTFEEKVSPA